MKKIILAILLFIPCMSVQAQLTDNAQNLYDETSEKCEQALNQCTKNAESLPDESEEDINKCTQAEFKCTNDANKAAEKASAKEEMANAEKEAAITGKPVELSLIATADTTTNGHIQLRAERCGIEKQYRIYQIIDPFDNVVTFGCWGYKGAFIIGMDENLRPILKWKRADFRLNKSVKHGYKTWPK